MTRRAFTIDWHGGRRLNQGDGLLTARGVYRVDEIREIDSRAWPDRWRYGCVKVGDRATWDRLRGDGSLEEWRAARAAFGFEPLAWIIETTPYRPGTRPGEPDHERCDDPRCEGCRPARPQGDQGVSGFIRLSD